MRDPQLIAANEDERLIPAWSIAVAAAAFVLVEYYFWLILPTQQHHAVPLGFSHLFQSLVGSPRRSLFPHGGLRQQRRPAPRNEHAVLDCDLLCHACRHRRCSFYFLLRAPLVSRCPACATHVQSDFHFCPQCNYQLAASCGNCFRTVRATDQFCTRCGHELSHDHMPARLRVIGE